MRPEQSTASLKPIRSTGKNGFLSKIKASADSDKAGTALISKRRLFLTNVLSDPLLYHFDTSVGNVELLAVSFSRLTFSTGSCVDLSSVLSSRPGMDLGCTQAEL